MIRRSNHTTGATIASLRRRGSIFTWFVVYLFALLPLITLIVHTGMVTLTRRQMQTAVNSAAIEGVRLRGDSSPTEKERREKVQALVASVFDDNLDPTDGDSLQLGVGPVIAFDNEPTDISLPGTEFKASRTIRAGNLSVYCPDLRLNISDEQHGDMVRGQFASNGDHVEGNDYSRADFLLSGDTGYVAATGDDAFLVRLRRTDDAHNLDAVANVSSHGPTIPFLFGRGPYGGTDFLNRRERGTIVRATGIAQAVPAMTVGVTSPAESVNAGAAPIWIELASWNGLTTNDPTPVMGAGQSFTSGIAGEFVIRQVIAVSDILTPTMVAESVTGKQYVPIYAMFPSGDHRVIGFGVADFQLTVTDSTFSGTITRLHRQVGQVNAAATWRADLSLLTPADLNELQAVRGTNEQPLLAPALVRSIR